MPPDTTVRDQLTLAVGEGAPAVGEGTTTETPKPDETKAPEVVSRAEFDQLVALNKNQAAALVEAGKKLAIIDKVAAMIQGKPDEGTLTQEEQLVIKELHRIMPSLKFLDEIPKVRQVVDAAAKATSETLVTAAFAYQLELQHAAGISIEDPKANFHIGAAIKEWINQDNTRKERFWRGDRSVIKEGFDEVKTTVLDPLRTADRKATTDALKHRPKSAAPGAGGGGGEGPKALDYSDHKAVRAALKAALV